MKPGQKHIIFDLDGTIFDTEFEVSRITAGLAEEQGAALSAEEVFQRFAGLGCDDKFSGIAKACGLSFNKDQLTHLEHEHESQKQDIYHRDHLPVVPGVPEVLAALAAAGDILSIGSSNPSARSRMGLTKENLLPYFEERIYGPDLVEGRKKPDPAVFLLAMQANGSTPGNTVVIEDTEPGIAAARAAGVFVIAYLDPRFGTGTAAIEKEKSFRAAGADAVIRDFKDVLQNLPQVKGTTAVFHAKPKRNGFSS